MKHTEHDDFWDIEKLIPKRERHSAPVRFDVSGVDISDGSEASGNSSGGLKLDLGGFSLQEESGEKLLFEYTPDNPLITKVRIYRRRSPIRYYEDFENTMHKYLRLTVKSAERVPFFSYVPQYSQLSPKRMSWYLYWRSGCRRREYMQTDYAYVLLYVYELLNFHNPKHPEKIVQELCSLWGAYRKEYSQLDRCMPGWVCDYCLIHRVSFPYAEVEYIDELIQSVPLREFYLGSLGQGSDSISRAVVIGGSGYSYRKSKYYSGDNKALFDLHIPSAAARAVEKSTGGLAVTAEGTQSSSVRRDAYAGALCTSSARRAIEIEYIPLYRSGELRAEATLAVKYAENKLRSVLGVRSRLSVTGLPAEMRESIDEYYAEHFGDRFCRGEASRGERDAGAGYMELYESPVSGLELGRAADIEARSWATAELMGEAFDGDEPAEGASEPSGEGAFESILEEPQSCTDAPFFPSAPTGGEGWIPETCGALDELCIEVLTLIAENKTSEAKSRAARRGAFLSDVCATINETALDIMGDILIECVFDEYYILEDYESEVKQWLRI